MRLFVLFLALNACAEATPTTAPPAATPAPTATTPPPALEATPPASTIPTPPPTAAACALVGGWTGTYPAGPQPWAGKTFTGNFGADGVLTAESAMGKKVTHFAFDAGTGVVTLTNSENTGPGSCTPDQTGHYAVTFGGDCNTFSAALKDDPCEGRKKGFEGVTFKRT